MSRKNNYSEHHIIPQKWKEDFVNPNDINDSRNKTIVKNNWHAHLHWKDGADTPVMIIMNDIKFNLKVLKTEFAKDLIEVLEKHIWNYYIFETRIQEEIGRLFELENYFNHKKRDGQSI